jgi:hypothetical protein
VAVGLICGSSLVTVYFALHKFVVHLLGENEWNNAQLNSWPGMAFMAMLLVLFLLVLVIQAELPQWSNRPYFRAVYVHARNGFYFNTLANLVVASVWPVKIPDNKNKP